MEIIIGKRINNRNLILKIILNVSGVSMLRELTSIKFSPWFGVCLGTKISYPMQPFSLSHETFLKLSNLRVVQNTTYNFAWSSPQIVSQISPPFGTKVLSSVTMYVSLGVPKAMPWKYFILSNSERGFSELSSLNVLKTAILSILSSSIITQLADLPTAIKYYLVN